jgi:hypothetical protein
MIENESKNSDRDEIGFRKSRKKRVTVLGGNAKKPVEKIVVNDFEDKVPGLSK